MGVTDVWLRVDEQPRLALAGQHVAGVQVGAQQDLSRRCAGELAEQRKAVAESPRSSRGGSVARRASARRPNRRPSPTADGTGCRDGPSMAHTARSRSVMTTGCSGSGRHAAPCRDGTAPEASRWCHRPRRRSARVSAPGGRRVHLEGGATGEQGERLGLGIASMWCHANSRTTSRRFVSVAGARPGGQGRRAVARRAALEKSTPWGDLMEVTHGVRHVRHRAARGTERLWRAVPTRRSRAVRRAASRCQPPPSSVRNVDQAPSRCGTPRRCSRATRSCASWVGVALLSCTWRCRNRSIAGLPSRCCGATSRTRRCGASSAAKPTRSPACRRTPMS